jgi:hypothetical protein
MPSTKAIELLYCCSDSQKDEELQQRLETHLSLMKRQNVINTWHKGMIGAGEEWEKEIDRRFNTADMILLLISSDLISSNYHWDFLVKRAMKLHNDRQSRVILILLRPYDNWKSEFGNGSIKVLPHKPVSKWGNYDHAFKEIAEGIREEAKALTDPYFPLKKSFRQVGAGVKPIANNIVGTAITFVSWISSSLNSSIKPRRRRKITPAPVISILCGLVLLPLVANLSSTPPAMKSRANVKSILKETSAGWIQLGIIDEDSKLSAGTRLLKLSNTSLYPSLDPPVVPTPGNIVTVKYKVNLRKDKFLSSEPVDKLQPGEKVIVQKVEIFTKSSQSSPYIILRAQIRKCDRICQEKEAAKKIHN